MGEETERKQEESLEKILILEATFVRALQDRRCADVNGLGAD